MATVYETITVKFDGATAAQKKKLLAAIVINHGHTRLKGETDVQLANRHFLDYAVAEVRGAKRKVKKDEGEVDVQGVDTDFPTKEAEA